MRKIQLAITTDSISSKDNNHEEPVMHSKSDNMKIVINDEADELLEELFKLLHNRYQTNLEKLVKSSEFVYNYVHLLY